MESPPPSDTGRPAMPIRHNQPNTPPSTHYIRPEQVARKIEVSVITLAELSVGPHFADTEAERIARQVHLQHAENDFDVIAFDAVRPVLSARRPALHEPLVASRRLGLTMP